MITDRVLKNLLNEKRRRIDEAQTAIAKLRERAFAVPEIADAQAEYNSVRYQLLTSGKDLNCEQLTTTRNKYEEVLTRHGYSLSAFTYVPSCTKCNDSGIVGEDVCDCTIAEYKSALIKECRLDERAKFSFGDVNLKNATPQQRDALSKLYAFGDKYVDAYPNVTRRILTFSGNTGTGKTCLASAMVRKAVLDKGLGVMFLSAYEFNGKMLEYHLSPLSERGQLIDDVITSQMLVIDDLGTEPILKNVTTEYLQLVLDERSRCGLCTIITTNLDEGQIKSRYGERIFSRLLDHANALFRRIPGNDLRLF